jgi:murein DD-endopeptidase MepM/ murein hydrolase activator NlpD
MIIRRFIFMSFLFGWTCVVAQDVQILNRTLDDKSVVLSVKNNTMFSQSVELNCQLKGMKAVSKLPEIKIVAAGETVDFVQLTPIDLMKAYSYGTSIRYIEGNVLAVHDDSYIYNLPFPKGKTCRVGQGYGGKETHQGRYALDFDMEIGSEIAAIRGGIVTKVVDNNDKGCPSDKCNKYNNLILITHSDGSIADYSHLKKNGAKVKVGDLVEAGQVIALSGDTGWASGPHLHLEVYVPTWGGQKTIAATYKIEKDSIGVPKESFSYTQYY